jgi:hypothetical protein
VAFNLTLTFWIGERLIGLLGCMLYAPVVVLLIAHPLDPMRRAGSAELARHGRDFPASPLALGALPAAARAASGAGGPA